MSATAARPAIRFEVRRLGRIGYLEAQAEQERAAEARLAGRGPDVLFLLEHPPVVTLGRNARSGNVLVPREELARRGVGVFDCSRGGDVTFHGPGQLVGYAVALLPEGRRGVHAFVRDLEEGLIRALADFGIAGVREPGFPGVWTAGEKIAALGVRIARWVTSHGFALNVDPDLGYFRLITPCGLSGRGVTSMARVLGRGVDSRAVEDAVAARFAEVFAS